MRAKDRVEALSANGTGWWWLAGQKGEDDEGGVEVANALNRVAAQQEIADIPRRFRNLTYYRHFTGRPTVGSYAFGMARRPATFISYYGDSEFTPPRFNLIGTVADVYVNRLLSHKVYVTMLPDEFGQRQVAKDLEGWVEAGFIETAFWDAYKAMGIDALCYGSGFLKWSESLAGGVQVEAVAPDELLFPNYDDPHPNTVIQRVWADREDIYDRYGLKDEAAAGAILKAQSAYPAFSFGPGTLNTKNVIPLLEGWRLPHADGRPGRHVLCVGTGASAYTLVDEPWEDPELPFVRFDFDQVPSSCFGQGISELLLSINEEVDRLLAVIQESDLRAGVGKWLVDDASNVNVDALGDTVAAAVTYATGTERPHYETPDPISKSALEHLDKLIALGMNRVHISAQAVAGELPKALQSAVALERYSQIDDQNFLEKTSRLEDVVLRSAYQMIRLGKKLKPSYTLPGRHGRQLIDWEALELEGTKPVGLQAYSTGRLGQSVAGKLQELNSMLAAGTITRELYNKYLQVPATDDLLDFVNAPVEGVDRLLDKLVLSDEYLPPVPFFNLDYAKQAAEARYIIESDRGTPQKQLDFLLQWRAAVIELATQQKVAGSDFAGAALPAAAPGAPVGTEGTVPGKPVALPPAVTPTPNAPLAPNAPQAPVLH